MAILYSQKQADFVIVVDPTISIANLSYGVYALVGIGFRGGQGCIFCTIF